MQTKKVFGVSISSCTTIPPILQKTIDYFEKYGYDEEGIFRVNGNMTKMQLIKQKFDNGEEVDYDELDPHTVAGILKMWLREIPDSLMTTELYDLFIWAMGYKDKETNILKLENVLIQLPKGNYLVLRTLFSFLSKLVSFKDKNKMHENNLAIIFSHDLLKPKIPQSTTINNNNQNPSIPKLSPRNTNKSVNEDIISNNNYNNNNINNNNYNNNSNNNNQIFSNNSNLIIEFDENNFLNNHFNLELQISLEDNPQALKLISLMISYYKQIFDKVDIEREQIEQKFQFKLSLKQPVNEILKNLILLIDVSGSMAGERIDVCQEIVDFCYNKKIEFTLFTFNEDLYQHKEGDYDVKSRVMGNTKIEKCLFECIKKIEKLHCLIVITDCVDTLQKDFNTQFQKLRNKNPFDCNLILIDHDETITSQTLREAFKGHFFKEDSPNFSKDLTEFLENKSKFIKEIDTLDNKINKDLIPNVKKKIRHTKQMINEASNNFEQTQRLLDDREKEIEEFYNLDDEQLHLKLDQMKKELTFVINKVQGFIEQLKNPENFLDNIQKELENIKILDTQIDEFLMRKGLQSTPFSTKEDKKKILENLSPFYANLEVVLNPFEIFNDIKRFVMRNNLKLAEKAKPILENLTNLEYKLIDFSQKIDLLMK